MTQELREILGLVAEGRITAEQGLALIEALEDAGGEPAQTGGLRPGGRRTFLIARQKGSERASAFRSSAAGSGKGAGRGGARTATRVRTRRFEISPDDAVVLRAAGLTGEEVAELKRNLKQSHRGEVAGS